MSTTASNADGVHIYTGLWVNWSHGRIRGATLTLPRQYGGPLAAFLVIFVTFAGGMFWRILCFILHQVNTTGPGRKRDLIHQQRQIILRNNSGPGGALLEWARLLVSWHGKARRPFFRMIGFILVALLHLSAFGIAGIFTSEVTKAPGNSTTILGPVCGGWNIEDIATSIDFESKTLADTYEAAVYVRQCYGENPTNLACGLLPKRNLGFTMNSNATCPFAPEVCDHSAFSMDTGMIDSYWDLGINTPLSHRIKYRRVTTCANLHGKRFHVENVNNETAYIFAGPSKPFNYTFSASVHGEVYGYTLDVVGAEASVNSSNQNWTPDPLLNRTDADVTLMMLNQNLLAYTAPSDDLWMPAHIPTDGVNVSGVYGVDPGGLDGTGLSSYVGDYVVNLMGCTDQYQMCNPNKRSGSTCTKLSGALPNINEIVAPGNPLSWTTQQALIAIRILDKAFVMGMFSSVGGRGASALNANERAYKGVSAPIPPTQWQTEVKIWFSTGLARLQSYMVEWATAPTNIDLNPGKHHGLSHTVPTDPDTIALCGCQLVHNPGSHISFSMLGITIILVLGGTIILLGMAVDTVVGWMQAGTTGEYRRTQWVLEEKLHLQRAAYEGLNVGGRWDGGLHAVPITLDAHLELPPSSDIFLPGSEGGTGRRKN